MTMQDAQAIARKLDEQKAALDKQRTKNNELEVENRKLRNLPKLFAAAQEEIVELETALAAAAKRAQDAEVHSNRKIAELAGSQAEVLRLSVIVDAHAAEESARRRVADLVGGVV